MSRAVRQSVVLPASPEEIWAVVMDPHRLGEWVTTHRAVEDAPSGELREGSTFRQRMKLSGAPFEVSWTVAEIDRPRLARWEGRGPARSKAEVRYELHEEEGGTRFDYENEFSLPGGMLGRMAAGVVSAAGSEREARKSLENLRSLLERRG